MHYLILTTFLTQKKKPRQLSESPGEAGISVEDGPLFIVVDMNESCQLPDPSIPSTPLQGH